MNTTDTACADAPCVFDLSTDPGEHLNLNASRPDVTARLLKRFQELSVLAQASATVCVST